MNEESVSVAPETAAVVVDAATVVDTPAAETPAAVVETPVVETPAVEASPEDKVLSKKFAALSRREKELVERERQLKETYEEKVTRYEQAQSQAKLNPVGYLESLGITMDDVAAFILNDNQPTPDLQYKALQDKIDAIEKARLDELQAQEDARKRQQDEYVQNTINQYKTTVRNYLSEKAAEYEFCAASDETADIVWEVTEAYFQKNNEVLSIDDALKATEAYFEEQLEAELEQYSKLNKWKQKVTQKVGLVKPEQQTPKDTSPADTSSVTLTNKVTTTPEPKTERVELTADTFLQGMEDSKKRAAAFLAQQLAKK